VRVLLVLVLVLVCLVAVLASARDSDAAQIHRLCLNHQTNTMHEAASNPSPKA
jgi:hypothetical protein